MSKHRINVERDGMNGFQSLQSAGTDALNALSSIDGVEDIEIDWETDNEVSVLYRWTGKGDFWEAGSVLAEYGLKISEVAN